jgi:hypothetical protein
VNVVSIVPTASDHLAARDAFGQAAYSGLLPRRRWAEAQDLVSRYDDATDDAARIALADAMSAIIRDSDDSVDHVCAIREAA